MLAEILQNIAIQLDAMHDDGVRDDAQLHSNLRVVDNKLFNNMDQ